jgi:sigma-E factor negative regulatory protein RseC
MMVETGRVRKVFAGNAVVEIQRQSACAECHAQCVGSWETDSMLLEVRDPIGVQVGQEVEMAIQTERALKATMIVYGIPVVALVAGVVLGDWLGKMLWKRDALAVLLGLGGAGLSLIIVKIYNNIFKRDLQNQPVIVQVVEK